MLAAGQLLTGIPVVGVWLTSALAVVACYWMLLGMVPPKWSAIGAATLVVHPGFQLTWGQSYWGGTLAFAGGALVLGAAARLSRPASRFLVGDAVTMAIGALVLAITRPFEGLVVCLLVAGWVVVRWAWQGWPPLAPLAKRVLLPQCIVLALGAAALAGYNVAVTGDWRTMPYQVHEQAYGICPLFLFDAPHAAPEYLHESIRKFHAEWSMGWFDNQQSWRGLAEVKWGFLYYALVVLAPFPLLSPIVLLPWWRGRNLYGPMAMLVAAWLVTQIAVWNWPHYMAPIAPVVLLVSVYGLRNLRVATRQWTWSPGAIKCLLAAQAVVFVSSVVSWVNTPAVGWQYVKAAHQDYLEQQPGKHLVLVEYSPTHHPHEEWVYNGANLDEGKVLWAHAMSAEENAELIDYFDDREVWQLDADLAEPKLARYGHKESGWRLAGADGGQ
jgi:hypothetical protein